MLDYTILDEMIDTTVSIEDKLRYLGLSKETALAKDEAYIADFRSTAEKLGISGDHKLFFFKEMCGKVDLTDNEQLRFFCSVVGDSGLLFGESEGDHRISLWLTDSAKSDYLYDLIT